MKDLKKEGLKLHKKVQEKISTVSKIPLKSKKDIHLSCTLGASYASRHIHENKENVHKYTGKLNTIAVISDGSHVFEHGNIGAFGSLPAIEAKCALISEFSGVNAVPIAINTQDTHKIVDVIKLISPGFGAIMLEDIEFPKCDIILERLRNELRLPVFHNNGQITAVITLAALINALKVTKRKLSKAKIVILGAGVSGNAIARIIHASKAENLIVCDKRGPLYKKRPNMNAGTNKLVDDLKLPKKTGSIKSIIEKADVVIGTTPAHKITKEMISSMAEKPIIITLSQSELEINPKEAKKAGAKVVASGLFEHDNHIDNTILFPGLARAAMLHKVFNMTEKLFLELAEKLASLIKNPTNKKILPDIFEKKLFNVIEEVVLKHIPQPKKKKSIKKKAKKVIKKLAKKVVKKPAKKVVKKPVKKVAKKKLMKKLVRKLVRKPVKKIVKKAVRKPIKKVAKKKVVKKQAKKIVKKSAKKKPAKKK